MIERAVRDVTGGRHSARAAWRAGRIALLVLPFALLAGCAGPKPVLYPNDQLRAVGQAQADQDIADCRQVAEQAGASEGSGTRRTAGRTLGGGAIGGAVGAAGGAVLGRPGTGAAFGAATGATAGLMRSMFGGGGEPSQAYRNVVDRCLRERGYEPAGWD